MNKKAIYYIIGGVAILGIGYYLWNKRKKSAEGGKEGGAESPADATATKSAEAPADATANSKAVLTTRKEKRKACGVKPIGKKRKALWQKCVDEGGIASFEGDFDDFENEYIDFSTQLDNQFMFSEFSNNLDLDI